MATPGQNGCPPQTTETDERFGKPRSTGFAAVDRIILEGAGKYHYSNNPTYHANEVPSVVEHWNNQSEVAPYPIVRPSCFYDQSRQYSGEEMRQIVDLSQSHMAGYRANQGDFNLEDAKLLRSTEHVSVALLNLNHPPHFNRKQQSPRDLQESDQYLFLPHYLARNAHVTILLEAGGLERHSDLFHQYNKMCLVALPDGQAHPNACVRPSDDIASRLELLRRVQLDSERLNWLMRATTFRIIWGQVDEETHGGITTNKGVRANLREALEDGEDPAENMIVIVCPDTLATAQATTKFFQAEPVDAECLHHESPTFRTAANDVTSLS